MFTIVLVATKFECEVTRRLDIYLKQTDKPKWLLTSCVSTANLMALPSPTATLCREL